MVERNEWDRAVDAAEAEEEAEVEGEAEETEVPEVEEQE
jgi:hypothetical protein